MQGIFSTPQLYIKIQIYNILLTSDYAQKHTESLEILHFSWGIVIKSIELSFHGQSPQPWEATEKKILELRGNGKTSQESRLSHTELHESDLSLLS